MSVFRKVVCGTIALACWSMSAASGAAAPDPGEMREALNEKRMACETGDGDACLSLAGKFESRKDFLGRPVTGAVRRDDVRAAYYYRKACALDLADGCEGLGRMYAAGKGVERDRMEAQALFHRACTLRHEASCAGGHAGE